MHAKNYSNTEKQKCPYLAGILQAKKQRQRQNNMKCARLSLINILLNISPKKKKKLFKQYKVDESNLYIYIYNNIQKRALYRLGMCAVQAKGVNYKYSILG